MPTIAVRLALRMRYFARRSRHFLHGLRMRPMRSRGTIFTSALRPMSGAPTVGVGVEMVVDSATETLLYTHVI